VLLLAFALIVLVLCGLWILVPMLFGPPWIPTRMNRIRKALQLAEVKPDEIVYDLGCGDGRVLVIAAGEFGARAVGIEIGPVQCAAAWLRAVLNGVKDRVQIRWGNFYQADLKDADVVFAYLTSTQARRLEEHLANRLKPGARVVTISFDFPDWQPSEFHSDEMIFIYQIPPIHGNLESYLTQTR
jgi:cyclopropane fatty-acyl-phospholipid synthase-like methyltransferase